MSKELHGQDREVRKGRKLEYLYDAPSKIAPYSLLGSAIRAIGKEWDILVSPTEASRETFQDLRDKLVSPSQLTIKEDIRAKTDSPPPQLVLLDNSTSTKPVKEIRDKHIDSSHIMVAGTDEERDDYDLISKFSSTTYSKEGITAITGPGKGKSTTAFGIAAEAAANGEKAAIIQWFKEPKGPRGTWSINEHYFPDMLQEPDRLTFYPTGAGFYSSPNWDRVKEEDAYTLHRTKAEQGIDLATRLITSDKYKVVVLDEMVDTLAEVSGNIPRSLLSLNTIEQLVYIAQNHPDTHVVVTGRKVTSDWQSLIKDSHVIEEVIHPWSSKGKSAVSGLDF